MECASSPISRVFRLSSNFITRSSYLQTTSSVSRPLLPRRRTFGFRFHSQHFNRFRLSSSLSDPSQNNSSHELAILLEVEGVLMDVHRMGNRKAFNIAFKKLGLDCANWSEPVYLDLLRQSVGDEERMVILYFNKTGWPTSLPTNEKQSFTKNVLKEKKNALDDLVISKDLPLRPGAEDFIDDALREDVPVIMITAYSKSGENIARSIIEKLGHERMSKLKMIVGKKEVENSFYGQLVLGKGVSDSLDEQLARQVTKAAAAEKQRIAEEVAALLKLSVDIDTSSTESLQEIVAGLRAGAEYGEVPVSNCVLIAGSQLGVYGAERIGMPCVVLRSSLTARAEFPSASAVMDGFGGADLSLSRLRNKRQL